MKEISTRSHTQKRLIQRQNISTHNISVSSAVGQNKEFFRVSLSFSHFFDWFFNVSTTRIYYCRSNTQFSSMTLFFFNFSSAIEPQSAFISRLICETFVHSSAHTFDTVRHSGGLQERKKSSQDSNKLCGMILPTRVSVRQCSVYVDFDRLRTALACWKLYEILATQHFATHDHKKNAS